jgi:hypothetical protein
MYYSGHVLLVLLVILLFGSPLYQLVVCPLILVHPPEEDEEEADECLFIQRELFLILVQTPHNLVRNVDDIGRFMRLPVVTLVLLANKKFDVVYEARQDLLSLAVMLDQLQKLASHILTGLMTLADLEGVLVIDGLVEQYFFQLFQAIIV